MYKSYIEMREEWANQGCLQQLSVKVEIVV
jgi:hypothetical protein